MQVGCNGQTFAGGVRTSAVSFNGPWQRHGRGFSLTKKIARGFVQLLIESLQRYDVALRGYVLMDNHYHLIADPAGEHLTLLIPIRFAVCISQPFWIRAESRRIARLCTQKVQTVERTVNDSLSRLRVKLSDD